MADWVTSDLHFGHKNIIKYCPNTRGHFQSVEDMNQYLEREWVSKVKPQDTIYHLGDFSFMSIQETVDLIRRLPGNIIFIRGNHDEVLAEAFDIVRMNETGRRLVLRDYMEIKINKVKICLFHFPQLVWNKGGRGALHFHGHCHGTLNHLNVGKRRIDVGFDSIGQIMKIEDVVKKVENGVYEALDHHAEGARI